MLAQAKLEDYLRTGDSVEGEIRGPKDAERYFALLKVNKINFDELKRKKK